MSQAVSEHTPAEATSVIHDHMSPASHSKRLALLSLVGLTLVFAVSFIYRPQGVSVTSQYFTICGFKNLTGLPCPGCGLVHSFCAIGKGEIASAAAYNLLGLPLFAALGLLWLRSGSVLLGYRRFVESLDRAVGRFRVIRLFVAAFLVYGAGRLLYYSIFAPEVFNGTPLMRLISSLS